MESAHETALTGMMVSVSDPGEVSIAEGDLRCIEPN
jgi:hypothetical protein